MRDAGAPSRYARRPSISSSAAEASRRLPERLGCAPRPAWAPAPAPPLPGRGHGLHAREHEHLLPALPRDLARVEPQRVADHEQLRLEHAPPAPGEAHVDPQPPRPAPGHRHGPAEQRLQQLAAGRRQHAALHLDPQRIRLLLDHGVRAGHALDGRAAGRQPHPDERADRQHDQPHAGHVQRRRVEGAPGQAQRHPEQRREEGAKHQPVRAPEPAPARRGRPRHARRRPCPGRAAGGG